MSTQQVPLLTRVVLLHAAALGVILTIMQVSANIQAMTVRNIEIPITNQSQQAQPIKSTPQHIKIPRINIDVAVVPGHYNPGSRTWEIAQDKAQSIVGTTPNLTMIYGHNTAAVFELTNSLQPGDELLLTNSNGRVQKYRYISDHLTVASDTSDLTRSYDKPTLALLTCNGFWSQDRRFMFFEPVGEPQS